jgi:hypothetical protein
MPNEFKDLATYFHSSPHDQGLTTTKENALYSTPPHGWPRGRYCRGAQSLYSSRTRIPSGTTNCCSQSRGSTHSRLCFIGYPRQRVRNCREV